MDSQDWRYLKVLAGLYVLGTVTVAVAAPTLTPWSTGLYLAVAGTLLYALASYGRRLVASAT